MTSSRPSTAAAKEPVAVPASPENPENQRKRGRSTTNEVEAAASDAAREIADLADTEPTPTRVPEGLLQRRLEKSHTEID